MKIICKQYYAVILAAVILIMAIGLMTTTASAWGGGNHRWAAEQATTLFREGLDDPTAIKRNREWPLYPELISGSYGWDPKSSYDRGEDDDKTYYVAHWEFIRDAAIGADDACWAAWGLNHFWRVADGLHDNPYGYDADNSWETTYLLWQRALIWWQLGDPGWAYTLLGYCMHHLQDTACPAHANDDTHSEDQLEDWFTQALAEQCYDWDKSTSIPEPGPEIPWPSGVYTRSNAELLQDILGAQCWDVTGCDYPTIDVFDFPALVITDTPGMQMNMQKYFYLQYWTDQVGNYFASDDEDGASNAHDPTGWLHGYPNFPEKLWDGNKGEWGSVHSWESIEDNDDCDCDYDGDLTTISKWTYGAAFKASPVLIDLFRMTVDNVPPVTTVKKERTDGTPIVWCNNSPVTVSLIGATDYPNPGGWRESGLWKVWGNCNGEPPTIANDPEQTPFWLLNQDGTYNVELLSIDNCGNVEGSENDFTILIDMTPPVIEFPDLRPNYLTSETLTIKWTATDSGPCGNVIPSEIAYLDGQQVADGDEINLSELAGNHKLEVYATDAAGNMGYAIYEFEVWIDADGWCFSVNVNNKTDGNAMTCSVEFPAPYNIGLISLSTSTLAVKGALDLEQSDPIIGETAVLQAQLLTGVGDNDTDGIPDRKILFRKDLFIRALGGQTGNIPSLITGGLLPSGQPRFIADVTVPVFKSTKK